MGREKKILWGVLLIAVGVIFGLDALDIAEIHIFFDGWWTLFLIIPCGVGLFTETNKTGNLIGFTLGIFLLLCCRDILAFEVLLKLIVPVIVVIIGLNMVYNGIFANKANKLLEDMKQSGKDPKVGCATFSGTNMNFDNEVFEGAELSASFGGVKCDLRNAIIANDCAIHVTATFGGITILVPEHVNVKVNVNCMFGGVDNKKSYKENAVTIYIDGTCMFGGVDIK